MEESVEHCRAADGVLWNSCKFFRMCWVSLRTFRIPPFNKVCVAILYICFICYKLYTILYSYYWKNSFTIAELQILKSTDIMNGNLEIFEQKPVFPSSLRSPYIMKTV
jgi:hypothetical protein